jgi:hypothetical protein
MSHENDHLASLGNHNNMLTKEGVDHMNSIRIQIARPAPFFLQRRTFPHLIRHTSRPVLLIAIKVYLITTNMPSIRMTHIQIADNFLDIVLDSNETCSTLSFARGSPLRNLDMYPTVRLPYSCSGTLCKLLSLQPRCRQSVLRPCQHTGHLSANLR